jgi:hypothetical protein
MTMPPLAREVPVEVVHVDLLPDERADDLAALAEHGTTAIRHTLTIDH